MTTQLEQAARQALEALESKYIVNCGAWRVQQDNAASALRAALDGNQFNPDWDAMAVMVEEQQRMAKRIEELEQPAQDEHKDNCALLQIPSRDCDCQPAQDEPVALKGGECWPEYVMQEWDYWRKQIADGDKGSAPRDWFEELAELKLVSYARCEMLEMEIKALEEKLAEAREQPAQDEPEGWESPGRKRGYATHIHWSAIPPWPFKSADEAEANGWTPLYTRPQARDVERSSTERKETFLQPLTGGDERRHIICLCPDCTKSIPDRKPLTNEQINEFFQGMEPNNGFWLSFARAIEAAHGIGEKQ